MGQKSVCGVCNSWNIMYGLCMHAFDVIDIPFNLCGVSALATLARAYVDMQLNLYVAHSTSLRCATNTS